MNNELLPCPFCGADSCRVIGGPGTVGGPQYWAGCDYCHGRAWGDTEAEAIAAWNRRTHGQALASNDSGWREIESAPKGGGAELVTDPAWVEPPHILLLFENGAQSIGYWDWYYAEGGSGYEGGLAWIEPCSGERLNLHYDAPIAWQPLPAAPKPSDGGEGL